MDGRSGNNSFHIGNINMIKRPNPQYYDACSARGRHIIAVLINLVVQCSTLEQIFYVVTAI